MPGEKIAIERHGPVGVIRLNDPARMNAVSEAMMAQLAAAFTDLSGSARAIVLTSTGRAFCAGGGLDEKDTGTASDFGALLESHINPLMLRLRELPVPWITAVRGAAAGFGCSLALAGDMIVAAESAFFVEAFSLVGLVPDGGSCHLLARTAGRPRAMEAALLGERISSSQALAWGLINRVVPDDALESVTLELAAKLADGPASLGATRQLIWEAMDSPWNEVLSRERDEQRRAGRTQDATEGVTAFLAKRRPRFIGA